MHDVKQQLDASEEVLSRFGYANATGDNPTPLYKKANYLLIAANSGKRLQWRMDVVKPDGNVIVSAQSFHVGKMTPGALSDLETSACKAYWARVKELTDIGGNL